MTCINCLYYDKCQQEYIEFNEKLIDKKFLYIGNNKPCKYFKDKELFVKLPCKIGEEVYTIRWWDNKKKNVPIVKGKLFIEQY